MNVNDTVPYIIPPSSFESCGCHVLTKSDNNCAIFRSKSEFDRIDPISVIALQIYPEDYSNDLEKRGDFSRYINLERLIIWFNWRTLIIPISLQEIRINYTHQAIQFDIDLSSCKNMKKVFIENRIDGRLILPPNLIFLHLGQRNLRINEIIGLSDCKLLEAFSFHLGCCPNIIHVPYWVKRLAIRDGDQHTVDLSEYSNLEQLLIDEFVWINKLILPIKRPINYKYIFKESWENSWNHRIKEIIGDQTNITIE